VELLDEKIHLWINSARFIKPKPGIYILYDRKLDPIYIGESDNLKNQFSKYLDTNFENNACKQKTHTYQRTFTTNQKERKNILLEQFKTKYGRLPCCNSEAN
jgi:excinuclease UvrABC nuclease subunit